MAFAESKAAPIGPGDLGLDRTWINNEDKVQLIQESPDQSKPGNGPILDTLKGACNNVIHSRDELADCDQGTLSVRQRLSSSARRLFHKPRDASKELSSTAPILADAPPTHSHSRLAHHHPAKQEEKLLGGLIADPVKAVKTKIMGKGGYYAAANLAAKEISHGCEVELVEAHDEIMRAQTAQEKPLAIGRVDEMLAARQDMFVRWTIDRHVTRVRVLPQNYIALKTRADFVVRDGGGKEVMDWEGYIAHLMEYCATLRAPQYVGFSDDPPPPSKEIFIPSLERLLVSSTLVQKFAMRIRRIYRWEDRGETLRWLIAFTVFWAMDMLIAGFFGLAIYLLVRRKIRPPDIEDLRKDIIRTENIAETAFTLAEFIEKEGDEQWVDPFMEKCGPWLLLRLNDVASLMEIIQNFYEWRAPHRTAYTVWCFVISIIVLIVTPRWLLSRLFTFALGFGFFALSPICSRYSKYRLIASPVRWFFWNIPTHGEWAIKVLQAEAARHRGADTPSLEVAHPSPRDPVPLGPRDMDDIDAKAAKSSAPPQAIFEKYYSSYKCKGGHLVMTSIGVKFEPGFGRTGQWDLRYQDLTRVEKITRPVQKKIGRDSGSDLRLVGRNDIEHVLVNMEERDECFSQIVGYSDVTWQIVW